VTDDELAALALAADPDVSLDDDAVPLSEVLGRDGDSLLPAWYMPRPMHGRHIDGWRRQVIVLVIAAFLVITAYGLCNTYGQLHLR